jgi:hypothetical protein
MPDIVSETYQAWSMLDGHAVACEYFPGRPSMAGCILFMKQFYGMAFYVHELRKKN